jgi:hypothetical protein
MADPFRDGRYGVLIGVNALGVQLDEKHISSAGPDDSWNILFQSATAFQDDGYSAEFMIPFLNCNYPIQKFNNGKLDLLENLIRREFKPYLHHLKIFQLKLVMHAKLMRRYY